MKIWFPAIRADSGADVFVERLASGLRARGVDAVISWFPKRYEVAPYLLSSVPAPPGTDLIHANTTHAYAFKRPSAPLIATELHYPLDPAYRRYKSWVQHAYHRWLLGKYLARSYMAANAVTTISRFTAEVLAREAGVEVERTIPLWLDMNLFRPRILQSSANNRPFRLFFVGNGSRRKGADVLVELANRLGPSFEIRCTGGLRQQMPSISAANIAMLGRLTEQELILEYQTCDAVLAPSRYEGFGYAALEAMACGKPVVGFACGAVREVLGEAADFLADVDDVAGLATNCRAVAANDVVREKLGEIGRRRALHVYNEENAVVCYLALYDELLHKKIRAFELTHRILI